MGMTELGNLKIIVEYKKNEEVMRQKNISLFPNSVIRVF